MYQVVNATGNTDLTTKGKRVLSWHFEENAVTPAAARVLLRNGSATGDVIVPIRLAASDSKGGDYSNGLGFPLGVFVEVVTGTVRGSVDIA